MIKVQAAVKQKRKHIGVRVRCLPVEGIGLCVLCVLRVCVCVRACVCGVLCTSVDACGRPSSIGGLAPEGAARAGTIVQKASCCRRKAT
jgi:hypothetical protein